MKYKYYISFDDESSYSEVLPSKKIDITGMWVSGTWIDRVEVSDVYIGRLKNNTIYDTLNSWYTDPVKFREDIFFKIEKGGVLKWKFIFGIKFGEINQTTKTYSVTPESYDLYRRELQPYLDEIIPNTSLVSGVDRIDLYNFAGNKTFIETVIRSNNMSFLIEDITDSITISGSPLTIISTFLNDDNDESGNPLNRVNGILQDYVTGEEEFMTRGISNRDATLASKTLSDMLKIYEIFQVFYTLDSSDLLRFEHIKYFIDYLESNAVSITINDSFNVFSYSRPELTARENAFMADDPDDDEDFIGLPIIYDTSQNDINAESVDFTFSDIYSNLEYWKDNKSDFEDKLMLFPSTVEHIRVLTSNASFSFTTSWNTFEAVSGGTFEIISNDIECKVADGYSVVVELDSITGTFTTLKAGMYDRGTGALISSFEVNLSLGTNTFTLQTPTAATDGVFKIKAVTTSSPGAIEGYINLTRSGASNRPRAAWQQGAISAVNKIGAPFSLANIMDNWWKINRPSNRGKMNSTSSYTTFTNSQYNLQRNNFRMYYPDDINMRYGLDDGTRIGKIDTYRRNLDTDFVEFSITYPEDD